MPKRHIVHIGLFAYCTSVFHAGILRPPLIAQSNSIRQARPVQVPGKYTVYPSFAFSSPEGFLDDIGCRPLQHVVPAANHIHFSGGIDPGFGFTRLFGICQDRPANQLPAFRRCSRLSQPPQARRLPSGTGGGTGESVSSPSCLPNR